MSGYLARSFSHQEGLHPPGRSRRGQELKEEDCHCHLESGELGGQTVLLKRPFRLKQ